MVPLQIAESGFEKINFPHYLKLLDNKEIIDLILPNQNENKNEFSESISLLSNNNIEFNPFFIKAINKVGLYFSKNMNNLLIIAALFSFLLCFSIFIYFSYKKYNDKIYIDPISGAIISKLMTEKNLF